MNASFERGVISMVAGGPEGWGRAMVCECLQTASHAHSQRPYAHPQSVDSCPLSPISTPIWGFLHPPRVAHRAPSVPVFTPNLCRSRRGDLTPKSSACVRNRKQHR